MGKKGLFITFEGGEGCGKSSHIKTLAKYLERKGFKCLTTREPGGPELSEKIRDLLLHEKSGYGMCPETEILLFEAARAQHVREFIKPNIEAGNVVISDRFADSTTAYQGVARALDMQDVSRLNKFAVGGCTPDLTVILDLPPEAGLARARLRDSDNSDRMGSQPLAFYESVRQAFLDLARAEPSRFAVVDSSGSKEETFSKIAAAVEEKLNVGK